MDYTFRPISTWPGEMTSERKRSRFGTGYGQTLSLLERELWYLSARDVVFELALDESQIRRDGRPRADARPNHPGVVLSFGSGKGPLRIACDRFTDWEDNLRAIALALEALRMIDRYGVSSRGEQYVGWRALPPPQEVLPSEIEQQRANAAWMAKEACGRGMYVEASDLMVDAETARSVYRFLAKKMHPDIAGGSSELFKRLREAYLSIWPKGASPERVMEGAA